MGNLHTNAGHTWTWNSNASSPNWLVHFFCKLGRNSSKRVLFCMDHLAFAWQVAFQECLFKPVPWSSWNDLNWQNFCFYLTELCFWLLVVCGKSQEIKGSDAIYKNHRHPGTVCVLFSSEPSATFWIAGWMLFNKQNVVQFMFQWGCFTDLKNISSTRSITTDWEWDGHGLPCVLVRDHSQGRDVTVWDRGPSRKDRLDRPPLIHQGSEDVIFIAVISVDLGVH